MGKMDIAQKKCLTPEFRVSFPALLKPKAFQDQEAKYSIVMLFDTNEDLKELKRAAYNAAIEKFGPKDSWPKKLRMPFRRGDERGDTTGYAGKVFVNASSKEKPGLVDQRLRPIESESVFYAGCYARATLIAFAYDKNGNKGVSFSLQNVQKLRDGDPFSGRKRPEDEFDAVDDGSDDEDNYDTDTVDVDADADLYG